MIFDIDKTEEISLRAHAAERAICIKFAKQCRGEFENTNNNLAADAFCLYIDKFIALLSAPPHLGQSVSAEEIDEVAG